LEMLSGLLTDLAGTFHVRQIVTYITLSKTPE
jgi:hypothetical protein